MDIKINAAMQNVIARVKTAGLHEVSRREHGLENFSMKEAAQLLGTQLLHNDAKYASVQSGLRSLRVLSKDLTMPKTASYGDLFSLLLEDLTEKTAVSRKWVADKTINGAKHRLKAQGSKLPMKTRAAKKELKKELGNVTGIKGVPAGETARMQHKIVRHVKNQVPHFTGKDISKAVPMGKKASMFDLRTMKGLLPKAEQAGATGAMPALKSKATEAASHNGIFNKMEGTADKAFNPSNTLRGKDIPMELPAMRQLPKIAAAFGL